MANLQSMFTKKEVMNTTNEAMTEILKDKDLNLTEINHLIYAAATVMTEEINGTGCYKSVTPRVQKHPHVQIHTREYKWYQDRTVSYVRNKRK